MKSLYTIQGLPPEDQAWLEEKFLALTDSAAAHAVQKMRLGNCRLLDKERVAWTRFILSLMHRTPEKVEWFRDQWAEVSAKISKDVEENYNTLKRPGDPETYAEMKSSSDPYQTGKSLALLFKNVMDSQTVGNHLINMRWSVAHLQGAHRLLTSDRPLVMSNGMIHAEANIVIALDPEKLFVATNTTKTMDEIAALGRSVAKIYNDTVSRQAARFVYSVDIGESEFISRRLGKGKVQFLGSKNFDLKSIDLI